MIKTVYTSEYIVNSDNTESYNKLPNTVLNTIKKDLQLEVLPALKVICNVLALGNIISKDLESSGALTKIEWEAKTFEQTPPFDRLNYFFSYQALENGVWVDKLAGGSGGATADGYSLVQELSTFAGGTGVDLITERYAVTLGGDIRNLEIVFFYGTGEDYTIATTPEITTPPTLVSFWLKITQEA